MAPLGVEICSEARDLCVASTLREANTITSSQAPANDPAIETGDTLSRDEPSTEPEPINKLQDVAEYHVIYAELEAKAPAVKNAIEEFMPVIDRMQAFLSQRGSKRLKEAGLPTTWEECWESLNVKFGLGISLRTIQRKLKKFRSGDTTEESPKKRCRFYTGRGIADYRGMLVDLMSQVVRLNEREKLPEALMRTVADYEEILNAPPPAKPKEISRDECADCLLHRDVFPGTCDKHGVEVTRKMFARGRGRKTVKPAVLVNQASGTQISKAS